jgi:hypothetical protein
MDGKQDRPSVGKGMVVTAWNMFCYCRRDALHQQYPTLKGTQITSLLSVEWQRMDHAARSYFVDLSMQFRGDLSVPSHPPPQESEPALLFDADRICAGVSDTPVFIPHIEVTERKQFGRAATEASKRASLSVRETLFFNN